ncbi:MAG: Flp pilus assembly complex ATPase component TadA [Desulfobacterales bacterium]|nr:Flp pilus assembly complex ATPase component TadA [Desulfobacterales bacterium]
MDKTDNKLRVGDLLVQEGIITQEQLNQALLVQKDQEVYKPLGEVCVELKFLSKTQLNQTLSKHKKRIRLGELLVNIGLITQEQLQEALEQQKSEHAKLGDILVKKGFLTEASLINTLTIQLGVPKIVPDFHLIDKKLLEGLSEEFLRKNEALPAFREGNVLTVIMGNPLDEETIRDFSNVFKCKIEPAIAPSRDIQDAIKQHYRRVTLKGREISREDTKDLVIGDTDFSQEGEDSIVGILDYIITNAIMEGASDIHIEPKEKNLRIRYRIDGILRHKTDLPAPLAPGLVSRIKALCGLDIAEKRRHQDGRIEARIMDKEVDLRISVYASSYGENVVIRVLHRLSELVELDALGISPANRARYQKILDQPAGIILVTGPTGSGKTTTLYASINYLNDGERAIITVEDPVEYTIDGVVQGQLDNKLGVTYMDFLKSMMRQDPDVIMVGEIRDATAAEAVIQSALTGHKVLSTFHTDDTTGALLRLMDMGIDTFLISSTVVSIVAQRLLRVLCTDCRKPYVPDQHLLSSFAIRSIDTDKFEFYQPEGCPQCGYTGFKGRTAIYEIMVVNDAIRDAILARKTSTQIRHIAREKANLISMREDGFYKATLGITSLEEILRVVFYNESDELSPRTAEEIIALCEDVTGAFPKQPDSVPTPQKISSQRDEVSGLITDSGLAVSDGEVYRIRFDASTIETETDQIADFFKAYQRIMEETGKALESDLLENFVDFIVYTVKRLRVSLKAEFLEFCLRVKEGKVKILVETLIPQRLSLSAFHASKETGLRLINFLIPPLGIDEVSPAESSSMEMERSYRGRASMIEFLKPKGIGQYMEDGSEYGEASSSRPRPAEETAINDVSNAKGSGVYRKHVEEVEFNGYQED